jgi:hypothetical protein
LDRNVSNLALNCDDLLAEEVGYRRVALSVTC